MSQLNRTNSFSSINFNESLDGDLENPKRTASERKIEDPLPNLAINESDIDRCQDSFISDSVIDEVKDGVDQEASAFYKKHIPDFLVVPTKLLTHFRKTRRLSDR